MFAVLFNNIKRNIVYSIHISVGNKRNIIYEVIWVDSCTMYVQLVLRPIALNRTFITSTHLILEFPKRFWHARLYFVFTRKKHCVCLYHINVFKLAWVNDEIRKYAKKFLEHGFYFFLWKVGFFFFSKINFNWRKQRIQINCEKLWHIWIFFFHDNVTWNPDLKTIEDPFN